MARIHARARILIPRKVQHGRIQARLPHFCSDFSPTTPSNRAALSGNALVHAQDGASASLGIGVAEQCMIWSGILGYIDGCSDVPCLPVASKKD